MHKSQLQYSSCSSPPVRVLEPVPVELVAEVQSQPSLESLRLVHHEPHDTRLVVTLKERPQLQGNHRNRLLITNMIEC